MIGSGASGLVSIVSPTLLPERWQYTYGALYKSQGGSRVAGVHARVLDGPSELVAASAASSHTARDSWSDSFLSKGIKVYCPLVEQAHREFPLVWTLEGAPDTNHLVLSYLIFAARRTSRQHRNGHNVATCPQILPRWLPFESGSRLRRAGGCRGMRRHGWCWVNRGQGANGASGASRRLKIFLNGQILAILVNALCTRCARGYLKRGAPDHFTCSGCGEFAVC